MAIMLILIAAAVIGAFAYSTSLTGTSSVSSEGSSSSPAISSSSATEATSSATTSTHTTAPPNMSLLVDDSDLNTGFLDPGMSPDSSVVPSVFQGLVQYNGTDYTHVIPALASGWIVSPDSRNYTFTLRQNTWFSNRDPVNAYVAWFSFVRGLFIGNPPPPKYTAPVYGSLYTSYYSDLLYNGSSPCTGPCMREEGNLGSVDDANVFPWGLRQALSQAYGIPLTDENALVSKLSGILSNFNASATELAVMSYPHQALVVTNDRTLQFNLLEPYRLFPLMLPLQSGDLVDPIWIDSPSNCGGVTNNTYCPEFAYDGGPGTGPYVFGNLVKPPFSTYEALSYSVTLRANPNYWALGLSADELCSQPGYLHCAAVDQPANIPTVVVNFALNGSAETTSFDADKSQLTGFDGTNIGNGSFYQTSQALSLGYSLGENGLALNGQVFPTNITDFRLAVVHAINYSALLSTEYNDVPAGDADDKPSYDLFLPPAGPGWGALDNPDNLQLYSYNLTLAAHLLNESGWEGGFYTVTNIPIGGLPSGSVLGNPEGQKLSPLPLDMGRVQGQPAFSEIKDELGAIGIQVDPFVNTTACYDTPDYPCGPIPPGNYTSLPPMLAVSWYANWPDPVLQEFDPVADPYFPATVGTYMLSASVTNSTLSALLQRIPFETGTAQQLSDAARAWAMYAQLAGVVQLPYLENFVFVQPYLQGVVYNPFSDAYYYNMMYYSIGQG